MSFNDDIKQKRNKPCENCRTHRRKCKVTQGAQCDRCLKMNLACVFKFATKPTVLKKSVPLSKKNRMLEQMRIMEQGMAAMEEQLKMMNVKVHSEPTISHTFFNNEESNSSIASTNSDLKDENQYNQMHNYSTCSTHSDSECSNGRTHFSKRVKYEDEDNSSIGSSTVTLGYTLPPEGAANSATNSNWQLTVSQGPKGISFQTSIKNITDVTVFLAESLRYFSASPIRTPNYHANRNRQLLVVTNKMLKVETILHSFFQNKKQEKKNQLIVSNRTLLTDNVSRMFIKRQLIQCYFSCGGLLNAIYSRPYFLPLMLSQLNSLESTAIAAFAAFSQCRHVPQFNLPLTREIVAESFRQEAKDLLEDMLFEEEPSVTLAGSLMLLSQCALIGLENTEARLYMNLAWRMVLELKRKHFETLRNVGPETPVTPEISIAESWRRMFYVVRYLEVNLYMIYDGLANFSSILFDNGIGYPIMLQNENEKDVNDAISAFHHVTRLHDCQMASRGADELKYQLFAGALDSISISDIECLENQLIAFWKSLPAAFKLSDSPLEYLQTDRIQQCENPYAIYLNQLYYAYWLALETRLMEQPSDTDLVGADMDRFDGDRALLIVSVCCDSLSKIFHVLFRRLPCTVEMHWLLIASDAMAMLRKSANAHIGARAQKNIRVTLKVLKNRVQIDNSDQPNEEYAMWKNLIPSVLSADASTNTSTSSGSLTGSEEDIINSDEVIVNSSSSVESTERAPAAYFGALKKALNTYFSGYEQAQT